MILHTTLGGYLVPNTLGEWLNIIGAVLVLLCTAWLALHALRTLSIILTEWAHRERS